MNESEIITLKVTEPISDWYRTVDKKINPNDYDYFILRAHALVWNLEAYKGLVHKDTWQVDEPVKAIKGLKINEIVGNKYRTVNGLFNH